MKKILNISLPSNMDTEIKVAAKNITMEKPEIF